MGARTAPCTAYDNEPSPSLGRAGARHAIAGGLRHAGRGDDRRIKVLVLGHLSTIPTDGPADSGCVRPPTRVPLRDGGLVFFRSASLPGEARAVSHRSTELANPKGHFRCVDVSPGARATLPTCATVARACLRLASLSIIAVRPDRGPLRSADRTGATAPRRGLARRGWKGRRP